MTVRHLILACLLLAGCGHDPPEQVGPRYADRSPAPPSLALAVHPLHNPSKLAESYGPLVDLLNRRRGPDLRLESSRDYADFERKIRARGPDLLLPNPWQTLLAERHGYRVVAMAGDPADFRGLLLVRRDSGIRRPADLRGRAVAYPSPTALAACMLPQRFLADQGVDPVREVEPRYVGSQESAILTVFEGRTAAGATWPPPWRMFQREHPDWAAQLRVAWETPSLVNNSVMARDDLPDSLVHGLVEALCALDSDTTGRRVLDGMQTARFRPAGPRDYDPVRRFIRDFERDIRPVEGP